MIGLMITHKLLVLDSVYIFLWRDESHLPEILRCVKVGLWSLYGTPADIVRVLLCSAAFIYISPDILASEAVDMVHIEAGVWYDQRHFPRGCLLSGLPDLFPADAGPAFYVLQDSLRGLVSWTGRGSCLHQNIA